MNGPYNKKSLPATAREAACVALLAVEREQAYANLVLKKVLDRAALPARESRLAVNIVYGSVRMRQALDHIIASLLTRPDDKLMTEARVILRLSLYQLHYLRQEPYAVVDAAVDLAHKYANLPISRLVNAVLRAYLRRPDPAALLPGRDAGFDYLHITLSYPKWLADYLLRRLGFAEAELFCLAMNQPAGLFLRANTLKLSRSELQAALLQSGVRTRPAGFAYETLQVEQGSGDLASLPAFKSGGCIVQGPASQLAAHALHPDSGARVLDLCAAPGGKSTHLAAVMGDEGELCAFDLHQHKVKLIEDNCRRLGLNCVKATAADAAVLPEEYRGWADCILLDAPCSGLGVLNARPDSRWHKRRADIEALAAEAYQLLDAAAGYLKPQGRLLYTTCTVTEEENQRNVARFLSAHPDFRLCPMSELAALMPGAEEQEAAIGGQLQLWPQRHGCEGFFLALLEKKA